MVSPDDYIPCDLFMGIGNIVQYRLAERNAKHHRWYDKIELSIYTLYHLKMRSIDIEFLHSEGNVEEE